VPRAESDLLGELVGLGLERREARWLIEEYAPGAHDDARPSAIAAAQRRLAGEPLQYVLGHWPFRSLDLDLDSRVLIPRPETELLVDVAISELALADLAAPTVLDIGCGSGAIGLSIISELADRGVVSTLLAVDESPGALAVARRNALKHSLHSVSFIESHWYDEISPELEGHVDLVVANPPYVSEADFMDVDEELRHEPRGALVSADSPRAAGFADLETVIAGAPRWLARQGVLVVEHGADHGAPAREAARSVGLTARTDCDLAGRERIMVASR
jgi:release factor glutamine methyltransferase